MAKKNKIATPAGELRWVFIVGEGRDQSEANDGSKMQKMASIVFKTNSPECKKLMADIDAVWGEYKAANPSKIKKATQPKSLGYKVIKDPDTDEDTDETIFAMKTNSTYPDGKPNNIVVYSGGGKKLVNGSKYIIDGVDFVPNETFIGNGSIGVLHGEAAGYEYAKQYGVSLYLKAVQLGTLVEGGGDDVTVADISGGTDNVEEVGDVAEMPAIPTGDEPQL